MRRAGAIPEVRDEGPAASGDRRADRRAAPLVVSAGPRPPVVRGVGVENRRAGAAEAAVRAAFPDPLSSTRPHRHRPGRTPLARRSAGARRPSGGRDGSRRLGQDRRARPIRFAFPVLSGRRGRTGAVAGRGTGEARAGGTAR
jgi:hypothetical protein